MKKILILDCRNFGDSVIGLGLVEALSRTYPDLQIDALTRPQFASMRLNHPGVREVECASFPMGTMKNFGASAAAQLTAVIARLNRRKYDAVVNIVGDLRENLIGFLINGGASWAPIWEPGHPMLNFMRPVTRALPGNPIKITKDAVSVYEAVNQIARSLGATAPATPRLYDERQLAILHRGGGGPIAFHASATQPCRIWPAENWLRLGEELIAAGHSVRMFCGPAEKDACAQTYASLLRSGKAELIAAPLQNFFKRLSECELLISLDSFALHVAYALNVPRVMVNGPNIAEVWAPPGTIVLERHNGLPCHPCFNRPTCESKSEPYVCIRNVTVEMAVRAVQEFDARRARNNSLPILNRVQ